MYFGNSEYMLEVQSPLQEMPANSVNFADETQYQNGGKDVVSSRGSHKEYDITVKGNADTVGIYEDFQQGLYGNSFMRFTEHHAEIRNLFPPNWAAPRLIEVESGGWPDIYDLPASFADSSALGVSGANPYRFPPRYAIHTPSALTTVPFKKVTIPVAANKTLRVGWTGAGTNGAGWYARGMKLDGTYDTIVALTALSASGASRFNRTFSGATYKMVEFFIYQVTGALSPVSTLALMAQAYVTTTGPTTDTGLFKSGKGVTGLVFRGSVQRTVTINSNNTGQEWFTINGTLVEVEQWRPR